MQRIPGAGLGFAGEGASGERIRIPEREVAVPDGSQPEVQPGVGLVDGFRADEGGVLIGEKRLPVKRDDRQRQEQDIAGRGFADAGQNRIIAGRAAEVKP